MRRCSLTKSVVVLACALAWAHAAAATTYTVTNTNDSGAGSLRAAILSVNGGAGGDTINFNITGAGCSGNRCTITLASALDHVTETVTIDGTTQPGSSCGNLFGGTVPTWNVVIDVNNIVDGGLTIGAASSSVRGLEIENVGGSDDAAAGIEFVGAADNSIARCNYLHGNGGGIVMNVNGGFIGGPNPGDGNLATNNIFGLTVVKSNNTIQGNFSGVDATGLIAASNSQQGIYVQGGDSNVVMHNLSSANAGPGILVDSSATNTALNNNTIGFNINGANPNADMCNNFSSDGTQIQDNGTGTTQSGNTVNPNCSGCAIITITPSSDCDTNCSGFLGPSPACVDNFFSSLSECQTSVNNNCGSGCTCTVFNNAPASCAGGCLAPATPTPTPASGIKTPTPYDDFDSTGGPVSVVQP